MIHLESCLETLKRDIKYDYVLTSPPDYAELGIQAHTSEWEDFLDSWVSLLKPTNNLVTVCTTDRKGDGRIYPKPILEREIMNYQKLIQENRAMGECDHPDSSPPRRLPYATFRKSTFGCCSFCTRQEFRGPKVVE